MILTSLTQEIYYYRCCTDCVGQATTILTFTRSAICRPRETSRKAATICYKPPCISSHRFLLLLSLSQRKPRVRVIQRGRLANTKIPRQVGPDHVFLPTAHRDDGNHTSLGSAFLLCTRVQLLLFQLSLFAIAGTIVYRKILKLKLA